MEGKEQIKSALIGASKPKQTQYNKTDTAQRPT